MYNHFIKAFQVPCPEDSCPVCKAIKSKTHNGVDLRAKKIYNVHGLDPRTRQPIMLRLPERVFNKIAEASLKKPTWYKKILNKFLDIFGCRKESRSLTIFRAPDGSFSVK
jgi:hypothetical protein